MGILHEAIRTDWKEAVRLIEEGADVNARDDEGITPLMLAVNPYDPDIVRELFQHGAELDAKDNAGRTALTRALEQCCTEAIWTLQERASSIGQLLTIDTDAASPDIVLLFALYTRDAETVRSLLDAGVDPNTKNLYGNAPLHWTAEVGHAEMLTLLLHSGADIHARAAYDQAALHIAAYEGNAECVQVLLEHEAEVDARTKRHTTPLIAAAFASSAASVRLLLEHGADIHAEEKNGTSALAQAGWRADEETIRTLLEWGAGSHEIHLRDAFRACFGDNNRDKAPLFLEAGLEVRLMEAMLLGDVALVQEFLSKEAEQSELDATLVRAAQHSTPEIVSLLLQAGADSDAIYKGRSALMAASQSHRYYRENQDLLIQAGGTKVSDEEETD